jgi:hypothetical protein
VDPLESRDGAEWWYRGTPRINVRQRFGIVVNRGFSTVCTHSGRAECHPHGCIGGVEAAGVRGKTQCFGRSRVAPLGQGHGGLAECDHERRVVIDAGSA